MDAQEAYNIRRGNIDRAIKKYKNSFGYIPLRVIKEKGEPKEKRK